MGRPYSLKILWHGRNRFLPAILAVSFSAVLIAVQFGVLLGTLAVSSRPIDHAAAQIWVALRDVPSIELGHPIPESVDVPPPDAARGRGRRELSL